MGRVLAAVDKANGFSMASFQAEALRDASAAAAHHSTEFGRSPYEIFKLAAKNLESTHAFSLEIQERYGQRGVEDRAWRREEDDGDAE